MFSTTFTSPKGTIKINKKRARGCVLFVSGGPEKTLYTQIDSSPTRVYVKAAVLFLCINENFSGSHLQELAQRFISNMLQRKKRFSYFVPQM